jgi:hypothetical protein
VAEHDDELEPLDPLLAAAAHALRVAPVPSPDPLMTAAGALRETSDGAAHAQVVQTRARVMASLERRRSGGRRRTFVAAILATIGTGTLSWAAATGHTNMIQVATQRSRSLVVEPVAVAEAKARRARRAAEAIEADRLALAPDPLRMPEPLAEPVPAPVPVPVPAPVPAPAPVLEATTAPAPILAPDPAPSAVKRKPAARPAPVEDPVDRALYRTAHAAHFKASDPVAALAAWDAYLAERPHGRFAIEARYNRALVLIRLDRIDDARVELEPFAAGAVGYQGYRQHDAEALIEALGRRAEKAPAR